MRSEIEIEDGTRAIEVAAMFEEAVVEVRHLTDARPRGVTSATRALIAGGLVLLGAGLGTFALAATRLVKLERAGAGLDAVVAAALAFGAFALLNGLLRRSAERAPRDFTIPAGLTGGAHAESFPLVRAEGGQHQLVFTPQMRGEVTLDGVTIALGDLVTRGLAQPATHRPGAHAWPIAHGARVRITLGDVTYLVSSVLPPRRHESPFTLDWGQQGYTGGVAVATGLFLLMIYAIPPDPKSLAIDDFMKNNRFPTFLVKAPLEEDVQLPTWLNKKPDEPKGGDAGARAKGESGRMGKEGADPKRKKYALKGPADNLDVHIAQKYAQDAAQKAGIIGLVRSVEGSHVAAIWGRESALGRDADNVMGGLIGTEVGESLGVPGGLGVFGSKKGGGGVREGIGVGDLPTIGHDGLKPGWGDPRKVAVLRDKKKNVQIESPTPHIQLRGGLDKEIVRRVIRKHLNEVKFCYEQELMKNADLGGRVMTEFTISGTGQVLASTTQSTSLHNAIVEQCITQAVRRWEFPKPDGGGIVIVAYPFVFRNAGVN